MKRLIALFSLLHIVFAHAQLNDTPPYNGSDHIDGTQGSGATRAGKVVRTDQWTYSGDAFDEWFKKRGSIDPSLDNHLICNPYRADGTALSTGVAMPTNFTGHAPVYSFKNWWPNIGPLQPSQGHCGLCGDIGPYFQQGERVAISAELFVEGGSGPVVTNETPYSMVLTIGSFPGNEQPGQCLTPVNPGETVALPLPPQGWWNDAIPELYASVAGLHPHDILGWHHSSHSPIYPASGLNLPDFGTPGFTYTLNSKFGTASFLPDYIFGGLHSAEGYDPIVSGDPGYGIALYVNDVLQGVIDIQPDPNDPYVADAHLVALSSINPELGDAGFGATQLRCFPTYQKDSPAEYKFITHETAIQLIDTYRNQGGWTAVYKQYQSNRNAIVSDIPLPDIIPGDPVLGAENETDDLLVLYPNPLRNKININCLEKNSSLTIYKMDGLEVYQNLDLQKGEQSIDISYLQKDAYIVRLETPKKSISKLFIKE